METDVNIRTLVSNININSAALGVMARYENGMVVVDGGFRFDFKKKSFEVQGYIEKGCVGVQEFIADIIEEFIGIKGAHKTKIMIEPPEGFSVKRGCIPLADLSNAIKFDGSDVYTNSYAVSALGRGAKTAEGVYMRFLREIDPLGSVSVCVKDEVYYLLPSIKHIPIIISCCEMNGVVTMMGIKEDDLDSVRYAAYGMDSLKNDIKELSLIADFLGIESEPHLIKGVENFIANIGVDKYKLFDKCAKYYYERYKHKDMDRKSNRSINDALLDVQEVKGIMSKVNSVANKLGMEVESRNEFGCFAVKKEEREVDFFIQDILDYVDSRGYVDIDENAISAFLTWLDIKKSK